MREAPDGGGRALPVELTMAWVADGLLQRYSTSTRKHGSVRDEGYDEGISRDHPQSAGRSEGGGGSASVPVSKLGLFVAWRPPHPRPRARKQGVAESPNSEPPTTCKCRVRPEFSHCPCPHRDRWHSSTAPDVVQQRQTLFNSAPPRESSAVSNMAEPWLDPEPEAEPS